MITTLGKTHIKRFIASQVPVVAQALAIGIGSTAPTLGDKKLGLETARIPLTLTAYDPVQDRIVFKAEIPNSYVGKITEIGLFSLASDPVNDAPSVIVSDFSQANEVWSGGTWSTANTRLGADSLRLSGSASQTFKARKDAFLDLSRFSTSDAVNLAISNLNTNVSAVRVRFFQDDTNYFTGQSASPAAGYQVLSIAKSTFTPTGNPSWANITSVEVEAQSGSGGAIQVDFDAWTFVDMDFVNTDMVLIAREVLPVAFTKANNTVNEIEFSMAVTV